MTDQQPPLKRLLFWKGQHEEISKLRGAEAWEAFGEQSLGLIVVDVNQRWDVDSAYDLVFVLGPDNPRIVDMLAAWPGRVIVDIYFDLDHFAIGSDERVTLTRAIERADCVTASPGANAAQLSEINSRIVLLPDLHDDDESADNYMRGLILAINCAYRTTSEPAYRI